MNSEWTALVTLARIECGHARKAMLRQEVGEEDKETMVLPPERVACRIALATWVALMGCTTLGELPMTIAAVSSTWYWQNPLPRDYSIVAIACPTVAGCVGVGAGGLIVTTRDAGPRVARPSARRRHLSGAICQDIASGRYSPTSSMDQHTFPGDDVHPCT